MKVEELINKLKDQCKEKNFEISDLDVCIVDEKSNIIEDFNIEYDGTDIPSIFISL